MILEVFLIDKGKTRDQARLYPISVEGLFTLPHRILIKTATGHKSDKVNRDYGCKTIVCRESFFELADAPLNDRPLYFEVERPKGR